MGKARSRRFVPAQVSTAAKVDASGNVKCSEGGLPLDQQCAFRVVRDLPRSAADVWIARPATAATPSWRFLRYAGIDENETYLLPDALIHGG